MSEWKLAVETKLVSYYRTGWGGVWDALVAAITGNPRGIYVKPVTFSCWVKADEYKVSGVQVNE